MAKGMQEELDKQNPVIDDIDTQLNRVTNQLKNNNAKLTGLVTQVGLGRSPWAWVGGPMLGYCREIASDKVRYSLDSSRSSSRKRHNSCFWCLQQSMRVDCRV
jgi:hypothetical protein